MHRNPIHFKGECAEVRERNVVLFPPPRLGVVVVLGLVAVRFGFRSLLLPSWRLAHVHPWRCAPRPSAALRNNHPRASGYLPLLVVYITTHPLNDVVGHTALVSTSFTLD